MKIAYLYLNASIKGSSVQNKVQSQIENLNQVVNVDGYFFTDNDIYADNYISNNIELIKYPFIVEGWFRSIKRVKRQFEFIDKWMHKKGDNYDYIILRQSYPNYKVLKFYKKYGKKIIVEVQSKLDNEIWQNRITNQLGLRPSKFLSWLEFVFIPLMNDFIFSGRILRNASKVVVVTNELKNYVNNKMQLNEKNKKVIVVANGIDVNKYNLSSRPQFDGKEVNMLLVTGASQYADWLGLDIIIKSVNEYSKKSKINLLVCGINKPTNMNIKNSNIKYLGYKTKEELDKIYEGVHVCIGSMSMDRIGLKEGSTLKIREYAAMGIPFVYGYHDDDFVESDEKRLTLRLLPGVFDIDEIIDYLSNFYLEINLNSIRLREYSKANIDMKRKMNYLSNKIGE